MSPPLWKNSLFDFCKFTALETYSRKIVSYERNYFLYTFLLKASHRQLLHT